MITGRAGKRGGLGSCIEEKKSGHANCSMIRKRTMTSSGTRRLWCYMYFHFIKLSQLMEVHAVGIVFGCGFFLRVVCVGTQRQTNTQTQARVLQRPACIHRSLPSSVTSLKLCDFLLLFLSPNSIFKGSLFAEVDHSSERQKRRCTQQNHCSSALLISSITPRLALHILSSRHISTA